MAQRRLVGFCGLLLINALCLNPVYHAEGIYLPATLLLAFVIASCCPDWFVQSGFKLFCAFIALIAVWALLQWLTGWGFLDEENSRSQPCLQPRILWRLRLISVWRRFLPITCWARWTWCVWVDAVAICGVAGNAKSGRLFRLTGRPFVFFGIDRARPQWSRSGGATVQ